MTDSIPDSELAALFAKLPAPTRVIKLFRIRPVSPVDPELFDLFVRECTAARSKVEEVHRRFKLKPSWKTICRDAATADDAFSEMEDAREHYAFWAQGWNHGWTTPAEALVHLALEANRQAALFAELGDSDMACQLYLEGQAYLFELEANGGEFRARLAAMQTAATAKARSVREACVEAALEDQATKVRGSLEELSLSKALAKGMTRKEIVEALEHHWDGRDGELGFDPYVMGERLAALLKTNPGLVEKLSELTGTGRGQGR